MNRQRNAQSRFIGFVLLMAVAMSASAFAAANTVPEDDPAEAPALVVAGDFNRDGIGDLVEVVDLEGSGSRYLAMMLGQRDGTFKEMVAQTLLQGDPRSIVTGDFNGDGLPDVIVGDSDGRLTEFLGDGTGKLVSAGEIARLGSVISIAVGDFNRDGKLDFAVSDLRGGTIAIYLGSGNGSFRPTWSFPLPMVGTVFHLAAADFNGDGVPDLAVTNEDQDTFEVMLGNGNGTFTYAPQLSKVNDPNAHCPA